MGILDMFGDLTGIKARFSLLAFEEFLGILEGLLSMLRDLILGDLFGLLTKLNPLSAFLGDSIANV
jgi:hypothetical protein